jgi:hypothetical protein
VGEDGRAVFSNVLVDQDSRLNIAQEPCQGSLSVKEREIAQILAIVLDQVERVQHRAMRGFPTAQLIEA